MSERAVGRLQTRSHVSNHAQQWRAPGGGGGGGGWWWWWWCYMRAQQKSLGGEEGARAERGMRAARPGACMCTPHVHNATKQNQSKGDMKQHKQEKQKDIFH